MRTTDYDIIYLSFDEPNAEKNYSDLKHKYPAAKRVHGVVGSDAAHKACAAISKTDHFFTIDGDNIVRPEFFNLELPSHDETVVLSFSGRNVVNDLRYGNGGIKLWPKKYVLAMQTHENADPNNLAAQVDFCWDVTYKQVNEVYSDSHMNAKPWQAWRAGFREGVKMSLNEGSKPTVEEFYGLYKRNLDRLYIWATVGADVPNGYHAILGARMGLYYTMCTDWDYLNVRDFCRLNEIWLQNNINSKTVQSLCLEYGQLILDQLDVTVPCIPFEPQQSAFFKSVYRNPGRLDRQQWIDKE
jgi:hypothetical protein